MFLTPALAQKRTKITPGFDPALRIRSHFWSGLYLRWSLSGLPVICFRGDHGAGAPEWIPPGVGLFDFFRRRNRKQELEQEWNFQLLEEPDNSFDWIKIFSDRLIVRLILWLYSLWYVKWGNVRFTADCWRWGKVADWRVLFWMEHSQCSTALWQE